jgi:hypothetical protein
VVSNGERVGKLSVVVEGTFMHMCDFLLLCNTARCVCCCQIAKWCNLCPLHSCFAQDDRMLGAAILHQVQKLGDTQAETVCTIQQAFSDDSTGVAQIKEWFNHIKDGCMLVNSDQSSGRPSSSSNADIIDKMRTSPRYRTLFSRP